MRRLAQHEPHAGLITASSDLKCADGRMSPPAGAALIADIGISRLQHLEQMQPNVLCTPVLPGCRLFIASSNSGAICRPESQSGSPPCVAAAAVLESALPVGKGPHTGIVRALISISSFFGLAFGNDFAGLDQDVPRMGLGNHHRRIAATLVDQLENMKTVRAAVTPQ